MNLSRFANNLELIWRTLSQPIRTLAEVNFDFACQSHELFTYQEIAPTIRKLTCLGMSNAEITK